MACIARTLEAKRKQVHEAMLKLEANPRFRRGYDRCSMCGKTRIVTSRRATVAPPSPDAEERC